MSRMKKLTDAEANEFKMSFGKFRGQSLETMPSSYLDWLDQQEFMEAPRNLYLLQAIQVVLRWRTRHNEHFEE